jgi:hypothetical protein
MRFLESIRQRTHKIYKTLGKTTSHAKLKRLVTFKGYAIGNPGWMPRAERGLGPPPVRRNTYYMGVEPPPPPCFTLLLHE